MMCVNLTNFLLLRCFDDNNKCLCETLLMARWFMVIRDNVLSGMMLIRLKFNNFSSSTSYFYFTNLKNRSNWCQIKSKNSSTLISSPFTFPHFGHASDKQSHTKLWLNGHIKEDLFFNKPPKIFFPQSTATTKLLLREEQKQQKNV